MLNKKAQVGDTIIWLVATIIIFVILFFFVFGASILGKTKEIASFKVDLFSKSDYSGQDVFLTKSLFTYLNFENTKKGNDLNKKLVKLEGEGKFGGNLNVRLAELKERLQA